MAVGFLAVSILGASACGTEPHVDDVRVSITTPALGGYRLVEATNGDEAVSREVVSVSGLILRDASPSDRESAGGQASDVLIGGATTSSGRVNIESADIVVGEQPLMSNAVGVAREGTVAGDAAPEVLLLAVGAAATIQINYPEWNTDERSRG